MKEKMLKNKWFIATVAMAVVALAAIVIAIVLGISGAPSGNNRVFGVGEEGVYYYEVVDGKVTLTLRDGNFTMSGKINKTGVYSVDGSNVSLDFFKDEDGTATATLNGDALSLVYNDANLSFLKETEYTVSFNVNGGSEISAIKVTNGKTVAKPANAPVKADNVFLGWYADEALTTPFAFDEVTVKSDITVYAKWAEKIAGVPDYVVSFVLGDYEGAEEIEPLTTVSGIAYGMPTPKRQGYVFGGWWISMYENGEKLSYIYKEGTPFTKDTTLYAVWYADSSDKLNAPAVSVGENMISWDAVNGAASYKLTVINPDGTVAIDNETVTGTSKEFKFADLAAGEYKISVVAVAGNAEKNSDSADRYFANKTLDKVSDFYVENGILVFGAVENAEKYVINIVCGNPNHSHSNFDNGTYTTYYLANCQMKEGGILITVTASAKGFASSTSDVFAYNKTLDAVENLKYDEANDKFVWNAVAGASGYKVTVTVGNDKHSFNIGNVASFSVAGYTGNVEVSVIPTAEGFNSPAATTANCQKAAPAAPSGLSVSGNLITWTAVDGSNISYEVSIGNQTVKTTETSINIASASLALTQGKLYTVKVKAINANGESSSYSEEIEVGYFAIAPELTYNRNTVYWTPVLGAELYQVRVNGGEPVVIKGANSAKVTLTKEGANLIEVRYVYGETFSDWSSVTVNAFAVEYDTRTVAIGTLAVEYLAVGDLMSLPTEGFTYDGFEFSGWYNAPKGSAGNGKIYGEGTVFTGNAYTVVYAEWTPKTYNVTLNIDGIDFTITNLVSGTKEPVTYTKDFELTVPKAQNTGMYFFAGWYTGTSGRGTKITDENGKSLVPYDFTRDITLYPYYSTNALTFTLQDDGTYAVSKGDTIKEVTNLKIPVTYNEIPVTVILENAFSSCTTIKRVEIPDTIKLVGTGAFNGCSNLEYIDVYVAKPAEEGKYETFYSDDNGVLIREDMGTTWLEVFPRAMKGEYTIPEDVEMILPKAFYFASITKITIPKSINEIPEYAFYSCTSLEEIVFEGGRTTPIEFVTKSFYYPSYNSKIKSITLPALMSVEFSSLKSMFNYMYELASVNVEEGGTDFASVAGFLTDDEKKTILYCPRGYSGDLSIPQGITAIGDNAFEYCDFITSVTIPVWVTNIGKSAFQYCEGITDITFKGARSENLTIGDDGFWCVYALETVTFEGNGTDTLDKGQITLGKLAFYGSGSISKLHTVTIGDGVNIKSISAQAFQTQSKLVNFIVSDKAYIGAIETKAFEKCIALTSFKVPATVTSIAENAFNGCKALATLEFATAEGEKALEIADYAFNGCTAIKSIEIPDRLNTFEASAFEGCTSLKAITVTATNTKYVNDANGILYAKNLDAQGNAVYTELLFYPKALVSENGGIINNLPDTLEIIGGSAFSDNNLLKGIVIPGKVTSIGTSAFANCENLESVTFTPAAVGAGETATLEIGNSAFLGCQSLTNEFKLPDYTVSIGAGAFQGCTFTTFTVPKNVTKIGMAAFWGNETLEYVKFECTGNLVIEDGSNNTAAKGGAFSNCTALKRVDLPVGLTDLGAYTFYKCPALETVNIGNVTVEGGVYTVESNLTRIGNRAFEQCPLLTTIIIPKSVTAIGNSAFAGASKTHGTLTTVIFEKGGTADLNFGTSVFQYQSSLKVLNLPERSILPMPTALAEKVLDPNTNKQVNRKDANGNNVYLALTKTYTANCTTLTSMFGTCTSLAEINIIDDEAITGRYASVDGVLYTADKTVLLFCPYANVGTYKNGEPTYELIVPNTVELVITGSMNNCTELKTVTFAEFDKSDAKYGTQLLTIGNYTYSSASGTSYITIGGKTSAITKVNLPSHLNEISFNAFVGGTTTAADIEAMEPMEIIFNLDAKNVVIEKYAFYYSTVKALALPGIKSIGDYAFSNCHKLESITFASLDKSLTKLPKYMLQNAKSLKSFTIPAQIKEIGNNVFAGCASLTAIEIPETVTKLGNYAFQATGLKSVVLHSKLSFTSLTVSTHLFQNCVDLESVTFATGAKVTMIPNNIFEGCTSLTTINLDDFIGKITKIGKSSFKNTKLPAIDFTKFTALEAVDTQSFSGIESIVKVDLTKTKLKKISSAWNNLPNLEEIILPETMTSNIESASFTNDPKLAKVYLTKNFSAAWLANINSYVIQKSKVPVEIIIPADNKNFSIDEFGVVYDPDMQIVLFANPSLDLTGYVLPESVLQIGAYAFAYAENLDTLVIHEGVTTIEKNAFDYSSIRSVVIPSTVSALGDYSFRYSNLESVVFTDTVELPSKLTTFGSSVFAYSNIESIVIPDSVTTIANNLFQGCTKLKSITTGASMTALPNGIASQVNSLEEIIMQEGIETINWIFSSYSYKGKYGINNVKSLYIPASVKTIKSDAFCDFGNLETITFAEGSQLETIERYAFKSCVSLKTINGIPASLATIGEYAFKDCTSLEALDLSATAVTAIEQYTFHKASSLTDVKLPSGLTTIATYAFYNTGLKNLTVPATVTTIGVSAFENSALETVAFSAASTLTAIEENVFKGTENLKTVKLPNLLKEIGAGAFENSGVQEVLMTDENIPSSLTTIGASAFANCANLVGFAHLEQVTSIGEKAFFCCSNLENTKVSESLTDLGAMAFAFCNKLTEGYYPAKLATLGGNAYAGLDASKISLSSDNKNFVAVNENGVLTIYDYEKSIVYAVYGATGAYEITEKGTETYAPGALAGNAITSSNIPARLETVPNYMFMNCTSLASVDLAEELTEIGQYAFYNTALETITIPSTVKTIGDYAFAYNAKIDNVVIPKSAVTIGNYVFAYCQTLSNFDFESFAEGESVKTQKVGTHFFYNCPNITEVILPDKINITDEDKAESEISYSNDIPSYMFAGTGIVNANIYENGVAFYFFTRGVFANCEKLVSVYIQEIPDHSGSSYGYCSTTYFEGCDNLKVIYVDSLDKAGYTVGNMANGMWPELHVKNSVKDESTAALNATAYFDEARNADFEVHFDADGYADIVEYFAGLNDAWNFKVYDKDGNRLYCSETNGSIAYVEDAAGNVIWGTKPAN